MTFKKGQSGNPKGRPPKGRALSEEMRRLLMALAPGKKRMTNLEVIVSKLFSLARKGDKDAIKYICDRLEGRPAQALELTGDKKKSVRITYVDGNKEKEA